MKKHDKGEKATCNVSVWLTPAEVADLDAECERAVRLVPGATISRSAYMAELFRQDQARKAKAAKDAA